LQNKRQIEKRPSRLLHLLPLLQRQREKRLSRMQSLQQQLLRQVENSLLLQPLVHVLLQKLLRLKLRLQLLHVKRQSVQSEKRLHRLLLHALQPRLHRQGWLVNEPRQREKLLLQPQLPKHKD
jgi:hypothetical protein